MILMMDHKNNLYGCDHIDHSEHVEPLNVKIWPLVAEERHFEYLDELVKFVSNFYGCFSRFLRRFISRWKIGASQK